MDIPSVPKTETNFCQPNGQSAPSGGHTGEDVQKAVMEKMRNLTHVANELADLQTMARRHREDKAVQPVEEFIKYTEEFARIHAEIIKDYIACFTSEYEDYHKQVRRVYGLDKAAATKSNAPDAMGPVLTSRLGIILSTGNPDEHLFDTKPIMPWHAIQNALEIMTWVHDIIDCVALRVSKGDECYADGNCLWGALALQDVANGLLNSIGSESFKE